MLMRLLNIFLIAVLGASDCTRDNSRIEEPVSGETPRPKAEDPPATTDSKGEERGPFGGFFGPDKCQIAKEQSRKPPFFMAVDDGGVVITRIVKPCVTRDGLRGFENNTPWMAMGFPCSGGGGRVDWKDHFAQPKMVMFTLSTECAMNPSDMLQAKNAAEEVLGLPTASELLAYNPLAVQYWEMDTYPDADVGDVVYLRSTNGLGEGWQNYLKGEPLHIRIYGRENAWVQDNNLYVAEADIVKQQQDKFRLQIRSSRVLSESEQEEVGTRCRNLRPRRRCGDVF